MAIAIKETVFAVIPGSKIMTKLKKFDQENGMFYCGMNRDVEIQYGKFVDMETISFTDNVNLLNDGEQVVRYLYSLGIRNIRNVPDVLLYELEDRGAPTRKLLEVLRQIESGELQVETETDDGYTFIRDPQYKLDGLCQDALIFQHGRLAGQHNPFEASKLRAEGFKVFPLEKDSFGWLVGGVKTSKGIIHYG